MNAQRSRKKKKTYDDDKAPLKKQRSQLEALAWDDTRQLKVCRLENGAQNDHREERRTKWLDGCKADSIGKKSREDCRARNKGAARGSLLSEKPRPGESADTGTSGRTNSKRRTSVHLARGVTRQNGWECGHQDGADGATREWDDDKNGATRERDEANGERKSRGTWTSMGGSDRYGTAGGRKDLSHLTVEMETRR